VAQIIIYVGGILVLLLFGIMLTSNRRSLNEGAPKTDFVNVFPGLLVAAGVLGGLLWSFRRVELEAADAVSKAAAPVQQASTIEQVGRYLLTDYLLIFELLSIILLVALVAAAYIARRQPTQPRRLR
jgi:NADH-quinone oxidoreductase subunit J